MRYPKPLGGSLSETSADLVPMRHQGTTLVVHGLNDPSGHDSHHHARSHTGTSERLPVDVNQPENDKVEPDPKKIKIVVRITSRDRIRIAQRDVDWRSVRANIELMHAENPEAPVIIQPHPESRTETMVHVMDSARQAGVTNVSLAAGS